METASLFMNGRSQAVRLPAKFRFEGKQVFICRDKRTGNVILSDKPPSSTWQEFMALREQLAASVTDDFLADRHQSTEIRDPFAGWVE
jgi:antitoxin VapB